MAMHEIEGLVECSVSTLASYAPDHPQRRSICYSLYELQKQFDCGYTVLRVDDELEKLGFLYHVSPDSLPEPERSEALSLREEGGFLAGDTYFDYESQTCCVTAGSRLWKKLCNLGILPESACEELEELELFDLAEAIASLAAKGLSEGDEKQADTLGLWYALFPALCMVYGYDDDEAKVPSPERVQNLLSLLSKPEAFQSAKHLVGVQDMEDIDDMQPYLSGWFVPYEENKRNTETPDAYALAINECLAEDKYAEAEQLASLFSNSFLKVLYRSIISVNYHKWLSKSEEKAEVNQSILSLDEAETNFTRLLKNASDSDQAMTCRLNIALCRCLSGKIDEGVDMLNEAHVAFLSGFEHMQDKEGKAILAAFSAVDNYYFLLMHVPDAYAGKEELLKKSYPGLMTLSTARETMTCFLSSRADLAHMLYSYIGKSYLIEKEYAKARQAIEKALNIDPDFSDAHDIMNYLDELSHTSSD